MLKKFITKITNLERESNNKLAIMGFAFLVALAIAAAALLYALNKL